MSRYQPYQPNEVIVNRAVQLWKRALANPSYQNGDQDTGALPLAALLAYTTPKNNSPEILEAFGVALKKRLMNKQQGKHDAYFVQNLCVDYHPDTILEDAANEAGLKMEFPWKSSMFLRTDSLSVGFGYGSELLYHYPLPDGRWLVTTLLGSDICKVISHVAHGTPLDLAIEFDTHSVGMVEAA